MLAIAPNSTTPLAELPDNGERSPMVTNNTPTGTSVSPFAHITFDVTDAGTKPVNLASVIVTVAGVIAYQASVEHNGFSVVVTVIPLGFHFLIISPSPFSESQNVTVQVYAEET